MLMFPPMWFLSIHPVSVAFVSTYYLESTQAKFSFVADRESTDGGRLAVQVEDKVVRIRNVKVSMCKSTGLCFLPCLL